MKSPDIDKNARFAKLIEDFPGFEKVIKKFQAGLYKLEAKDLTLGGFEEELMVFVNALQETAREELEERKKLSE